MGELQFLDFTTDYPLRTISLRRCASFWKPNTVSVGTGAEAGVTLRGDKDVSFLLVTKGRGPNVCESFHNLGPTPVKVDNVKVGPAATATVTDGSVIEALRHKMVFFCPEMRPQEEPQVEDEPGSGSGID